MSNTFAILKQELILKKGETEGSFCAYFTPREDFPPFEGHFPDRKILPGVAQIAIVTASVQLFTGKELLLHEVKRVKFMNPAMPGNPLCITVTLLPGREADILQAKAQIQSGDNVISSLNLSYKG